MKRRATVVLLPGFGGRADQPILVKLSRRLEPLGLSCHRAAPPRGRVTPGLEREVAWLEALLATLAPPLVLVGRSFGGRIAVRLARRRGVAAVVLLGFPVRPPGKARPLDELALQQVNVPTLVVQGSQDELGPLAVIEAQAHGNPRCEVAVVKGAGHSFGRHEAGALDLVAAWLDARLE